MASELVLWLLLLVPLLLQVPLAIYLFRNIEVKESPEHADIWTEERARQRGGIRSGGHTGSTVTCQYCGATNDRRYEFCEQCVKRLR